MPVTDRMKDVSNSPHGTWRCRKRGTGIIASLQDPDFKGCAVNCFLWAYPLNSADKIRSDFMHRIGRKDRGIRRTRRRKALNEREKSEGNRANCGNFGEKHGKDVQNGLSEEGKHRTSRAQTSELLHRNIGGFAQRSPMFCLFQWKTRKKACIKECIFGEPMAMPCPAQTLQERYGRENSLNFHDSETLIMLSSFGLDVFPPKSKSRFKLIYRTYHNHSILNLIIAYTQKFPVSFG